MKLIYSPLPSSEVAAHIAKALVEKKRIACANWHTIQSCYEWEGATKVDEEVVLLCKTTDQQAAAAAEALNELHPYDVPSIMILPVDSVNPEYANWMESVIK